MLLHMCCVFNALLAIAGVANSNDAVGRSGVDLRQRCIRASFRLWEDTPSIMSNELDVTALIVRRWRRISHTETRLVLGGKFVLGGRSVDTLGFLNAFTTA